MTAAPSADLVQLAISTTEAQVSQANELARQYAAATADPGRIVEDILTDESIEDSEVKKFQAFRTKNEAALENAYATIREYVKANLLAANSENAGAIDPEAVKAQYTELKKAIGTATGYLKMLGVPEDQLAALPSLVTLRGTTGGTPGSTGDGPKRPRISHVRVNGNDVWGEKVDTKTGEKSRIISFTILGAELTKLAKAKVEPKDLREIVFGLAKTDDLSQVKDQTFSFDYSPEGSDASFTIEVTV